MDRTRVQCRGTWLVHAAAQHALHHAHGTGITMLLNERICAEVKRRWGEHGLSQRTSNVKGQWCHCLYYILPLGVLANIFTVPKPRLEDVLVNPITKQCKIAACNIPIRTPRRCRGKSRSELLNVIAS